MFFVVPNVILFLITTSLFIGNCSIVGATTSIVQEMDSDDSVNWVKSDWANGADFLCGWKPDHIGFSNSIMTITLDDSPSHDKSYSSGQYYTNASLGFGKYSARLKTVSYNGTVNALFLYDPETHDQIDIEILGKDTTQVHLNAYKNGTKVFGEGNQIVINLQEAGIPDASDQFVTYAFDYQPTFIEWFVNGVSVHKEIANIHKKKGSNLPTHPGKLMINFWAGNSTWTLPFQYFYPLQMEVDWARYDP